MTKQETAEQKLLKMIESSGGSSATQATKKEKEFAGKQTSLTAIRLINFILLMGVGCLGLLVSNEVRAGAALIGPSMEGSIKSSFAQRGSAIDKNILETKRLSAYLASTEERKIFQPFEELTAAGVVVSNKNQRASQVAEKYRLVGISWLDNVESASVMLEDKESKVTYFLQRGAKVGDLIVKTIYADSVELGYQDEEIIIRYDKTQM
jgi:hypothetical protein